MPFMVACLLVVTLLVALLLLACWLRRNYLQRGNSLPSSGANPEEDTAALKQWIFHPVVKPPLDEYDTVQPQVSMDAAVVPAAAAETICEDPPSTVVPPPSSVGTPERVHSRAKGLLERRGSNASLKIDLHSAPEGVSVPTPPRECTAEEYLLSAGNRLSRRQLRQCCLDPRPLQAEFWDIPLNHPERTTVAGSGTKNRYRTILPNEHSRVVLPSPTHSCTKNNNNNNNNNNNAADQLSTYINANYIRGYEGEERAYVATQGPLPHTVRDFWRMVAYLKPPAIVMITRLKEKGQPKCEPYIPMGADSVNLSGDSNSEHDGPLLDNNESSDCVEATYGDVTVTVTEVIPRDGYVVRRLEVQQGDVSHPMSHFWFTSWPDHKAPPSALSLVEMATEVEALRQEQRSGPVVVHCSAGIGRTGCFVALSIGMAQLLSDGNVDVLGTVCAMRYDRGGMVQTGEQYEFIHRALSLFERTLPDQSGD